MQSSQRKLNRRAFVKTAAAASTAFAVPQIIPSDVLAAAERPGANDRLIMGHIGVGDNQFFTGIALLKKVVHALALHPS